MWGISKKVTARKVLPHFFLTRETSYGLAFFTQENNTQPSNTQIVRGDARIE